MIFESTGPTHTEATLDIAFEAAACRGISTVVVASTFGDTGVMAAEKGQVLGLDVIVVTHNTGFAKPGVQQLKPEYRQRILAAGAQISTGTLVLHGVGSALRRKQGGSEEELIASVLRLFGQGMKVCVEMAAMASDAGLLPPEDAVFVAGTARGADTAVIIHPAASNSFFDIKVREVLAKPWGF